MRASGPAIDADAPAARRLALECNVNPRSQSGEIAVVLGGQDTAVRSPLPMQALEVTAVVSEYRPAEGMSASQDVRIRRSDSAVLLCSKYVVAELPQNHHHRAGEILVGVEQHPPYSTRPSSPSSFSAMARSISARFA